MLTVNTASSHLESLHFSYSENQVRGVQSQPVGKKNKRMETSVLLVILKDESRPSKLCSYKKNNINFTIVLQLPKINMEIFLTSLRGRGLIFKEQSLTFSVHAREGYSSHFVFCSVIQQVHGLFRQC